MRRGDVVRTVAEFNALPVGSEVAGIDGRVHPRDELGAAIIVGDDQRGWLPALVRVVGPVEPEYLQVAAVAAYRLTQGGESVIEKWSDFTPGPGGAGPYWVAIAKAAVAAADKARGIVNSREEFDALPAGTRVTGPRTGVYRAGATPPYPPGYPCIVLD